MVERGYYTAEARLMLSSGEVWGMVAFCFVAFLTSLGGLYAAYESRILDIAEPWKNVNLKNIKTLPADDVAIAADYSLERRA